MFGKKQFNPYLGPDLQPWQTPGFGDGIGAGTVLDTALPADLNANVRPTKPGFFGKGGGWKDALGYGLDGIAQAFGGQGAYGASKQRAEDRDHEMSLAKLRGEIEAQSDDRRRKGQFNIFGDDELGYFGRDGDGNISQVLAGLGRKEDPVIARLKAAGIDPNSPRGQAAVLNAMPGYGNSEEVFERRRRLKQTTPGKAPGTGGGSGGAKLPTGFILD